MKSELKEPFHVGALSVKTLALWLVTAGVTGLVCGGVGGVVHFAIDWATAARQGNPWLLYLLPVAGLVIVWCYRAWGMENDSGTNQIIASVRSGQRPPLIFLGTVLTHLTGGSAGREGAALQIGGSLSAALGKLFRLDERHENVMIMCGMSGLFSALFGTPLTATLFSMEVVSIGIFHYSAFFPCLLSAYVATGVTRLMGLAPEGYALRGLPKLGPLPLVQVGVLAVLCAVLSILFCVLMHKTAHLYARFLPNQYLRAAVGGVLIVLLTLLVGSRDYNVAGGQIIEAAMEGTAVPWAFVLKWCLPR